MVVQEKFKTFNVGQAFEASILPGIWGILLAGNHIARVDMFLCHAIPQGGIHLAGNQVARVAMFLHHARSPILVAQEKLKTFNVGQAFVASSLLGIWGIHLVGNQIVTVAKFLHNARSPLPVVQDKLQTFNVGQTFGAYISPGIWGIHLAGNQIVRVAMFLCHAIPQGASIWLGTRLQELPCFYIMQGHLYW